MKNGSKYVFVCNEKQIFISLKFVNEPLTIPHFYSKIHYLFTGDGEGGLVDDKNLLVRMKICRSHKIYLYKH